MELEMMGKLAKEASRTLNKLSKPMKNACLLTIAKNLIDNTEQILEANAKDIANGKTNNMPESLLDRLQLTPERIEGIAEGVRQVAALEDPIGEVLSMKERPNGLMIGKKRVPLGVIGIIYESRPNVTVDAFSLCFKTSNAVILRGGSDAIHSNMALVAIIKESLEEMHVTPDAIFLLEDTSRETATRMMKLNNYIDVLIPRGGAGLIQNVVMNSTIPVIQTGTGNCHVYVDKDADFDMAIDIIINAKTQRISVCNACESVVVHKDIADKFIPKLYKALREFNVEVRCDEYSKELLKSKKHAVEAVEEDWGREYLDYILSLKVVDSIDEAIAHINKYNTSHSEAIITRNYDAAQQFLDEVDSACVYVNASTRFSDGNEFGFGAEIGISTQKLHARGPMGLEALTSYKYTIYGSGQIRK